MRALFVVLAGAAACSPGDPSGVFADPEDGEAFLVDDIDSVRERAHVHTHRSARLLPALDPLSDPPSSWPGWGTTYTVVEPGPSPRVSWQDPHTQLLLYPDDDDFQDVTWQRTVAVAEPGHDLGAGVAVPAGRAVDVLDERDQHTLVHLETLDLVVEAWAPRAHIDRWWVVDETASAEQQDDIDTVRTLLVAGTAILDRPGGDPMAWATSYDDSEVSWATVTVTGPQVRGHVPVLVASNDIEVTGWVHGDDLATDATRSRHVTLCGCCGAISRGVASPNVPAETRLHASPDGPVVGRVLRDTWTAGDPTDDWVPYEIDTPWGTAVTWLIVD